MYPNAPDSYGKSVYSVVAPSVIAKAMLPMNVALRETGSAARRVEVRKPEAERKRRKARLTPALSRRERGSLFLPLPPTGGEGGGEGGVPISRSPSRSG